MRRLVAILLLFVFLFNLVGYRVFFLYLQNQQSAHMQETLARLSSGDKRLITFKIPINLPYSVSWKEFERVDGEVTFKGVLYRYVKQKVQNDTLILVCINDQQGSALQKHSSDYFKKVNDLAGDQAKKSVVKQTKNDYFQEVYPLSIALYGRLLTRNAEPPVGTCRSGFLQTSDKPPTIALG